MRKVSAMVAATVVLLALGAGAAGAEPMGKETICHGTASESHPYVIITVNEHSFKDGHFDDTWDKSHGANNMPDIHDYEGGDCGVPSNS